MNGNSIKKTNHFLDIVLTVVITGSAIASTRADETAVSFDDSAMFIGEGGTDVYGWQFSTVSDIQISALGLYDYYHGDGLSAQHTIAIWDVSNPSQPLFSAVIPAGSLTPIMEDFRYVNVTPVTLPAGHDYVIGALYLSDDVLVGAINNPSWLLTVGPGLQFGGSRAGAAPSAVLAFPGYYSPGDQDGFGPNFTYTIVPEPGTLGLLALGCSLGGGLYFRRK
jgi:hypothetical protein